MDTPEPRRASSRHSDLIERSLQRLDEAISSPSGVLRTRRSQPARFPDRRSLMSRRSELLEDLTVDLTSTVAGGQHGTILDWSKIDESVLEEPEMTMIMEDDPGEKVVTSLLDEFLETMQRYPAEHEMFEQLDHYQQLTELHVERLSQLIQRVPAQRGTSYLPETKQLHLQLSKERNTWRLLASLYRDRLLVQSEDADACLVDSVGKPLSDRRVADNLFKCDTTVRQAQLVVDWLELCAADEVVASYTDKVEFFGSTAVAWENTLHALQSAPGAAPAGRLTTSMDPDGPVREGAQLHDLDRDDERRLLRYMFVLLRAGRMAEAQELCLKVGQPWRAAALEGWKLYHDPNFEQPAAAAEPVQGNRLRDLWKLAAWQVSDDVRYDVHERAIFAALCGNLAVLLPVCESWEDRVWAYFKVFVDSKVEAEVRANTQSLRDLNPLPSQYPEKSLAPADIFREVAALDQSRRSPDDVTHLYNTIQKHAILGEEATMVAEMANFCKERRGNDQLMRSLAHITLFVRQCSSEVAHEDCVTVLEAYVKSLVERRSAPLVACYAGLLPPAAQVDWYAALMATLTEPAERLEALRLAERAGLDAQAAALAVVRAARRRPPAAAADRLAPETTDEDRRCVDAVQWLLFERSQRPDALREANAICRRLLLARKLAAARELMQQIPDDSITIVMDLWKSSSGQAELPPDQDNVVKEHLCIKSFLLSQDAYIDWSEQFYNQRPRRPELRPGASFTETVAHEQKLKQYESSLERWKTAHAAITKTTVERLYNVLLFPDGGWMADRPQPSTASPMAVDGVDEDERQRQMAGLRRMFVPQTVAVVHTVLHSSGRLKEATQLADLVAGEEYQLYKEFTQPELQNFLGKLRETSLELLDQNLDSLGYPFQ